MPELRTTLNPNQISLLPLLHVALAILSVQVPPSPDSSAVLLRREAWAMGTRLAVAVEAGTREDALGATEAAIREVEGTEGMLSSWDASSELSRVNAAPADVPVPVSKELEKILCEAAAWSDATDGAFSWAVGALVDAWGIRGPRRTPSPEEIEEALASTRRGAVEVGNGGVVRRSAAAWIDAGAFGKGVALDAAVSRLQGLGISRALVDLGGQVWALAPSREPWLVGVAHPRRRTEPVARLSVAGVSVATSGLSERPGHVLDPRTGRPAADWGSVTVVAADAMDADVLATALYVMGPVEGLRWATDRNVAALFLTVVGESLAATWTAEMEPWLVEPPDGVPAPELSNNPNESKGTFQ